MDSNLNMALNGVCVFAFKELSRYYVKHGSAMHVGFLDASKAFDRWLVPKYLLRILSDEFAMYAHQMGFFLL